MVVSLVRPSPSKGVVHFSPPYCIHFEPSKFLRQHHVGMVNAVDIDGAVIDFEGALFTSSRGDLHNSFFDHVF